MSYTYIYVRLKNNGMRGSVIPCPLQIIGLKCVFECAYSHGRSYGKTGRYMFIKCYCIAVTIPHIPNTYILNRGANLIFDGFL